MRARLEAAAGALLLVLLVAPCRGASARVIDNGLAPPSPANVIDGPEGSVIVRDLGCATPLGTPCPAPGDSTRVETTLGADVTSLTVRDTSRFTSTGGRVAALGVWEAARASVLAGEVDGLLAEDEAIVSVSGGRVAYLDAFGSAVVHVVGGDVGDLSSFEDATLYVAGGRVEAGLVQSVDASRLQVSGGTFAGFPLFYVQHQSRAVVSGGSFSAVAFDVADGGTLTLVGRDFRLDGVPVGYGRLETGRGSSLLTGTLADGSPLNEAYVLGSPTGLYLTAVPEPGAAWLLASIAALGGLRRGPAARSRDEARGVRRRRVSPPRRPASAPRGPCRPSSPRASA